MKLNRRLRSMLPIALTLFVSACVCSVGVYYQTRKQVTALFDSKGNSLSDFIQHAAIPYLVSYDLTTLQNFVTYAQQDPQVSFAAIFDDTKMITENSTMPRGDDLNDSIIFERQLISPEKKFLGKFMVGFKRSIFRETLATNLISTLLMILVGIGLIAFSVVLTFGSLARRARDIARKLIENSSTLAKTAFNVGESSGTLFDGSQQQAIAIQETLRAIEMLRNFVSLTYQTITKSNEAAEQNEVSVAQGQKAIQNLSQALLNSNQNNDAMVTTFASFKDRINEMKNIIGRIEEKTKIINDIVFQSRLLSFNASVEAARAGESGKGFAVVAQEVRSLAGMSGEAAADIANLLNESSGRVKEIVELTTQEITGVADKNQLSVKDNLRTIEASMSAFDQISSNSKTSRQMANELTQGTSSQTQSIEEIGAALARLDEVVQKTLKISKNSNDASASLLGQAEDIRTITSSLDLLLGAEVDDDFSEAS